MKRLLFILSIFFVFLAIPTLKVEASTPIKILLVPGHDDEVWGAQYGNVKEADMNLALAIKLFNILKKDKRFEVHITREWGGYTQEFEDYFINHGEDIKSFKDNAKQKRAQDILSGDFLERENNPHLNASEEVAIKLYGLNKWANENNIDAVIHIHFNDYPRSQAWKAGEYKGFAIYIPEEQMVNAKTSSLLAANIFLKLKEKYLISNYEKENIGLIPDQNLIALGSNGTLASSVRSVLIEYGYIYRFKAKTTRIKHYATMADLTAKGIKNYFFK